MERDSPRIPALMTYYKDGNQKRLPHLGVILKIIEAIKAYTATNAGYMAAGIRIA